MAKQLRLDVAQLTDIGRRRPHNEDNMAYVIPKDAQVMAKKGALFIVADGMGGHAAGEVASEIAVDTVSNVYYQDDSDDITVALLHAIRRANAAIHQRASENLLRTGMGTTCVAAVLRGNMSYIANVGDSRAYLVRGTQIKQVSQDHSWVAEQVRAGLLTDDQARTHAQRNVITRSLGTQAEVEVDVFSEPLQDGDSLILCTDGLSGQVGDEELLKIVEQFVPQESVYHLVEKANESGGPDNITAIVVRVNEAGAEQPNGRYPVRVGGPEEDTLALGMLPGSPALIHAGNGESRSASSPLRLSSEPLISPESITAPQPVLQKTQPKRSRIFYPSLVVLTLFLLAAIGSGIYYYIRVNDSQNVDKSIDFASKQIQLAAGSVTTNPTNALTELSSAQKKLRDVQQNHSLTTNQNNRITSLQMSLEKNVDLAIGAYNLISGIKALPCANTTSNPINASSTSTTVQSIASIQATKTVSFLYAQGADGNLYRLNEIAGQYSLVSGFSFPKGTQLLNIAGDGTKLLVLTEQTTGNTPSGYGLELFSQPDPSGKLSSPSTTVIDQKLTKNGMVPGFVSAWGNNVYVILSSKSDPNNASILAFTIDSTGHVKNAPKMTSISISQNIQSIVAFPDRLFILYASGGDVQSLQLGGSNPATISTRVQPPIAMPLSTSTQTFTSRSDVPTLAQPSSSGQKVAEFLSVPGASMLSAGVVNNTPHLYIIDPSNHRVLDLEMVTNAPGTPATNATPTPTQSAAEKNVLFQLQQQYVSLILFPQIKGMAVDPLGIKLYVLAQNNPALFTMVSASTGPQNGCS